LEHLKAFDCEGVIRRLVQTEVDSVQTGNEPPGTVYRFTDKELPPSDMFMLSLHDLNLVDTINIGRVVQKMPEEIVIYGVEVKRIAEFSKEMSPEVEAAVKEVADLVMDEINEPPPRPARSGQ